jgi:hypothetical protein
MRMTIGSRGFKSLFTALTVPVLMSLASTRAWAQG